MDQKVLQSHTLMATLTKTKLRQSNPHQNCLFIDDDIVSDG